LDGIYKDSIYKFFGGEKHYEKLLSFLIKILNFKSFCYLMLMLKKSNEIIELLNTGF